MVLADLGSNGLNNNNNNKVLAPEQYFEGLEVFESYNLTVVLNIS